MRWFQTSLHVSWMMPRHSHLKPLQKLSDSNYGRISAASKKCKNCWVYRSRHWFWYEQMARSLSCMQLFKMISFTCQICRVAHRPFRLCSSSIGRRTPAHAHSQCASCCCPCQDTSIIHRLAPRFMSTGMQATTNWMYMSDQICIILVQVMQ